MRRSTNGPPDARHADGGDRTTGDAVPFPRPPLPVDAQKRINRLRRIAWLLDRSIPLGGRLRIGLDPIVGLVPGAGDWIGAMMSLYILYEAARLGLPMGVLVRMGGNILLETIVGTVPVVGDLVDFAWQANMRNLELVDRHYRPHQRPRSLSRIAFALGTFAAFLAAILVTLAYLLFKALEALL